MITLVQIVVTVFVLLRNTVPLLYDQHYFSKNQGEYSVLLHVRIDSGFS